MTHRRVSWLLAGLVAWAGTGCHPFEPGGEQGALHEGGFVYCDPARSCEGASRLPDAVAVGAKFEIAFDSLNHGGLTVTSDDPFTVETLEEFADRTLFLARSTGDVRIEARDPDGDVLVDYTELTVGPVQSLGLVVCARSYNAIVDEEDLFHIEDCAGTPAGDETLTISRGESLAPTVCAIPLDASAKPMSGALASAFTAEGDADLEVHVDGLGRCASVGGLTLGDASVAVSSAGFTASLQVTVEE